MSTSKQTMYEIIKEMPLPYIVGYLANIHPDIRCTGECFEECWLGDDSSLNFAKKEAHENKGKCKQNGVWDKCPERLAFEIVLKAVNKMIEQKPIYSADSYDIDGKLIFDTAFCPTCNHEFEVDYDNDKKHCPECGQALDWRDNIDF